MERHRRRQPAFLRRPDLQLCRRHGAVRAHRAGAARQRRPAALAAGTLRLARRLRGGGAQGGGAGGTLGAGIAARAAPDGYNLLMGAVHHTIAPSMYPKLDYDLEKDLVPLTLVARVPQIVVVNPKNAAANDFKSFLELLRKN